jgi:hypothetical protein
MRRAFLFGAGATKAQFPNAPLSNDFFEKVHEVNGLLFDAIRSVITPYISGDLRKMNIEEIMIRTLKLPLSQKRQLISNIHNAISIVLNKNTLIGDIRQSYNGPETLFKTLLNDERLSEDDIFLTLNYDLYLDREIYSLNNKIDYGLNEEFIQRNIRNLNVRPDNKHSLYHLHGALNWELIGGGNKLKITSASIVPKYTRTGSNMCIVPPGQDKQFNKILQTVWTVAEKRLMASDELIIIGCSLNPNDHALLQLIDRYRSEKGSKAIKAIYLGTSIVTGQYEEKDHILEFGNPYKNLNVDVSHLYPFGFNIIGPKEMPDIGSLEFIFSDGIQWFQ